MVPSNISVCSDQRQQSERLNNRAVALLRTATAIAFGTSASGVAWSGCVLFWPTAGLAEVVADKEMPTEFLVRIGVFRQPRQERESLVLKTLGLTAFDLPEIRHPVLDEEPDLVFNRVMNTATYLLLNGPIVKDGDTFGSGTGPVLRVAHQADQEGKVELVISRIPTILKD